MDTAFVTETIDSDLIISTVFSRFVAWAFNFFNHTYYRALIQARALVIFKVKLSQKLS